MKKQLVISAITIGAMISISALAKNDPADVNLTKASVNVDWNRVIDGNDKVKSEIQKSLAQSMANEDAEEVSDESRTLDFVNLEIGFEDSEQPVVEQRPLPVDRRYNSVGAPRLL